MSHHTECKAEQRHPLESLLRFIQEHLECVVTVRLDSERIIADCVRCCHSRNIPLGSIESFLRVSMPAEERIATLECELAEAKSTLLAYETRLDTYAVMYNEWQAKLQVAMELLQRSKPFVEGVLADPIPLGERERLLKALREMLEGKQ